MNGCKRLVGEEPDPFLDARGIHGALDASGDIRIECLNADFHVECSRWKLCEPCAYGGAELIGCQLKVQTEPWRQHGGEQMVEKPACACASKVKATVDDTQVLHSGGQQAIQGGVDLCLG